ncbi:DUF2490 domain-containing protein [Sphingomonas sp. ST-64]|uniref:DUF2490 domain-containing protein n=1 Tax=Sphingomonas plantiphila TaxID=3163295 RepID=A0ABW8YMW5_9SPHN
MRSILIALPLVIATPAIAQDEDSELWLSGSGEVSVGERTSVEVESINRFSDDAGGLYEIELAAGVEQQVGNGWWVGGGYVRVVNYSRGTVTRTEDRFRVQGGASTDAGPFKLSARLRLERRTRSNGDDIGYRLRPSVKLALPLGDSAFRLFASHESFIPLNDTDWGERSGHDRMRNAAGISWKASKAIGVEAGYLNQYRFARGAPQGTMDHVLTLSLGVSL